MPALVDLIPVRSAEPAGCTGWVRITVHTEHMQGTETT